MAAIALPTASSLLAVYNVRSYGAKGDGTTDDTTAIQSALNAASSSGSGAICYCPPGNYVIAGQINVPNYVQLVGTYHAPPSPNGIRDGGSAPLPTAGGSTLLITGNAGNASATPAITLNWYSVLKGFTLYYPNQPPTATTPTAYPWAVVMANSTKDASVQDCCLLNPYQGILIDGHERGSAYRVLGQPISIGVSVTEVSDVCRLYDLHWNPIWSYNPGGGTVSDWTQANGTAFQFGRSDGQVCVGLFALGYHTGISFFNQATGLTGSTYGEFVGCQLDDCSTAVACSSTNGAGVRFVGGGMAGMSSGGGSFVNQSGGTLAFVGTGFWQPANSFTQTGGNLLLSGCTFRDQAAIGLSGTCSAMVGCTLSNAIGSTSTIALSGSGKATLTGNTYIGAAFSSIVSGTASGGTVNTNNN